MPALMLLNKRTEHQNTERIERAMWMDVDVNEGNIMGGRAGEPRRSSVLEKKNKSNFRRTTDLKKKDY